MSGLIGQAGTRSGTNPHGSIDYEEGTWTASIGGNASYSNQYGSYRKIGKMVFATFYLTINVQGTGANRQIYNLPFAASSQTGSAHISYFANLPTNIGYLTGYIFGSSQIDFYNTTTEAGNMTSSTIFGNNTTVQGTVQYEVA